MAVARWREIAEALAASIRSGDRPVGSYLPSHAATAKAHDVDRNTARKAADYLQSLGVIRPISGVGLLVIAEPPDPLLGPERRLTLKERVAELERRLGEHERGHG